MGQGEHDSPKCPTLTWGLFWAEGNLDPEDSGEAPCLSLNCSKEYRLGDLCQEESYSQREFLSQRDLEQQTFVSQALALLILLWVLFFSFEAPDPHSFLLSSGGHISLNCLTVFEPSRFLWGSCTYQTNFVHLFYGKWIIRAVNKSRKPSLLPLQSKSFHTAGTL